MSVHPSLGAATRQRIYGDLEVQIVSFGVENCDNDLVNECCTSGRGTGANIQFTNLELREALGRLGHPDTEIIVDARPFPDPAAMANGMTRHTGHHPSIIGRICRHKNFRSWLQRVKDSWNDVLDTVDRAGASTSTTATRSSRSSPGATSASTRSTPLKRVVTLATYCRSGKHRSVATSEIFQHIFQAEGLRCRPTVHLSQQAQAWRRMCGGKCIECTEPSEEKQDSFRGAAELWSLL